MNNYTLWTVCFIAIGSYQEGSIVIGTMIKVLRKF